MPTTEYFGYAVENLGPLTTTFTASPSCLTDTAKYVLYETQSFYGEDDEYVLFKGGQTCGSEPLSSDCVPSAAAYNSLISSALDDRAQGVLAYYSPASICPKGWTTAGVAASSSAGAKVKASGVFDRTTTPGPFQVMDWLKVATEALDAQETIALCCPSDFVADQYGLCTSNVGTYDPKEFDYITTLCVEYNSVPDWVEVTTFDGSSWDPPLLSQSAVATKTSTTIVTLTGAQETQTQTLNVVATAGPILLVHKSNGENDDGAKEEDSKNGEEGGGKEEDSKNESGSEDKSTAKGQDGEGAAPSVRVPSALALAAACIALVIASVAEFL